MLNCGFGESLRNVANMKNKPTRRCNFHSCERRSVIFHEAAGEIYPKNSRAAILETGNSIKRLKHYVTNTDSKIHLINMLLDFQSESQQNQTYNLVKGSIVDKLRTELAPREILPQEEIVPSDFVCHCWAQIYPFKQNLFVFHDTESKRNNRIPFRFTCIFLLNMKWDLHHKTWQCGISIMHQLTTSRTDLNFYLQMTND